MRRNDGAMRVTIDAASRRSRRTGREGRERIERDRVVGIDNACIAIQFEVPSSSAEERWRDMRGHGYLLRIDIRE